MSAEKTPSRRAAVSWPAALLPALLRAALSRCPHLARAGALVAAALLLAASYNAANPLGLRWGPSPDGRIGLPRAFESRLPEISAAQARELFASADVIFVDSRDRKDYDVAHIPGAVSLPMRKWGEAWPGARPRLPRGATLVLYCYGGVCGLSTRQGKRLLELGYQNLLVLKGGWSAWQKAGHPTVRGRHARGG